MAQARGQAGAITGTKGPGLSGLDKRNMKTNTLHGPLAAMAQHEAERTHRQSYVCPACGDDKEFGALVCQRCYKSGTPNGKPALKWSGLNFTAWLAHVRT